MGRKPEAEIELADIAAWLETEATPDEARQVALHALWIEITTLWGNLSDDKRRRFVDGTIRPWLDARA